jgi:IS30 family transposase
MMPAFGVNIAAELPLGDVMKRIAASILLLVSAVAWSVPAVAQRENRSIGENSREAKRAAKQQQKYSKKQTKRQRKAMKKYQKQQRKANKQQRRRR